MRNKTPKRRFKAELRVDRCPATRSNKTWAMDFVHDQLATGRKLRVLTIVYIFSRFSPALESWFTFRGADVVEILERTCKEMGFPAAIRVDQSTEFVSRDLGQEEAAKKPEPSEDAAELMTDGGEEDVGGFAGVALELASPEMTFRLEVPDDRLDCPTGSRL